VNFSEASKWQLARISQGPKMTTDIITGVRQAVQDFVAPEIRQLRGDISALDTRISALEK
jgi:hypothetical protein